MKNETWKEIENYLEAQMKLYRGKDDSMVRATIGYFYDGECEDIGIDFYFLDEITDDFHKEYVQLMNNNEFTALDQYQDHNFENLVLLAKEIAERLKHSSVVNKDTNIILQELD